MSSTERKGSPVLPLAVLGAVLAGALIVLFLFTGEEDTGNASGGPAATGATQGSGSEGDPSGAGPAGDNSGDTTTGNGTSHNGTSHNGASHTGTSGGTAPGPAATYIVPLAEVAEAHRVMAGYMAGLSTYAHTDENASWAPPLLAMTTGDEDLKRDTALPSGKEWGACATARCSSAGQARVVRDAMIADDLMRGSGASISSVVSVTAARSENGRATTTETNSWLVTARRSGGTWQVSAFDLYGLGNVGASDQAGG
ncbi:hypothetical protein NX801_04940 [Streptomyces sp. LP05-1]|uniref:Secreted protein n=1 Tax=Streptomyces pyxinae TaxID=2970734 RepID=A0ABT2CC76_9ACTN|nr:hypothetical protein [Streptomyces sp. LP05-1]MCS0635013.1 hypothetical protein [Streptomyces sp. LP05-1]